VFDRATAIRAAHNFKLGESRHLAAAAEAGCDRFLTNDDRLSAFPDIPWKYCHEQLSTVHFPTRFSTARLIPSTPVRMLGSGTG
jgi:hypothetical protein